MSKSGKSSPKAISNNKFDPYLLVAMLAAAILFLRSAGSEILNFDDNEYFTSYPEILKLSFGSIITYFKSYYVLMYQPLPVLSFAISYQLFKLDPTGHHIINIAFHLFNIYLVYKLVGKLFPDPFVKRCVALLFAIHPLAVEPVIWISCRSSMMYTCFYLLALLQYLRYRESESSRELLICIGWFLLSLLSKVHAVTFPLAIVALEVFHFKASLSVKLILKLWPFWLLSLAFGLIALGNTETSENIGATLSFYQPIDYVFILSYELVWYLLKIILPLQLAPIYVYPIKTGGMLPMLYYAALPIIIALGIALFMLRKKAPWLLFGIVFFYLAMSVTFQIVPSRLFVVADRYGYLPNIGIFIVLALAFNAWINNKSGFLSGVSFKDKVPFALMAVLFVLAWNQTPIWANDISLGERIIEINPETPYIARAYGIVGKYKRDKLNDPEAALVDFKKASDLDSTDMISRYQIALILQGKGDIEGAISMFRKAYKADRTSPMPYTDLGVLYTSMNRFNDAMQCADTALQSDKYFPNTLLLKAVCLLNTGKPKEAVAFLDLCIQKNPQFAPAYKNRGIIKINDLGDKTGACSDFNMAASLGDAESVGIIQNYCK